MIVYISCNSYCAGGASLYNLLLLSSLRVCVCVHVCMFGRRRDIRVCVCVCVCIIYDVVVLSLLI